ncbi:MAG TPA: translation initiation factor IF-2 [Candidatus Peribacterales bacterium]|nr:translation initiation factor IF-2 [Candidatus Peribacterales bacterium]
MRLIEVAKKLGMTGQNLRKELSEVDFGVKPTDREIPDQIAMGVIRFLARKHGIELKEEDMGELSEQSIETVPSAPSTPPTEAEGGAVVSSEGAPEEDQQKKVHVLRKLSLEGVTDAAVRAQAARVTLPSQHHSRPRRPSGSRTSREPKKRGHAVQEQIKRKEGIIELPEIITVKEFAEKTGVQVPEIIATLMKNGVLASINQNIDFDTAAIVAEELHITVKKAQTIASAENLLAGNLEVLLREDDAATLRPRAPIVTVMGHVDHGKTAILDAIRKTNVAGGEAGGITQKIGAYQVEFEGKPITFLDTPGHEAFTSMRARGAQITDIVVLVVAADEGIKPTTIEAINHAKDAGVPILVALNKIDREGADPDRVKGELAQHGLQPEEWGGTTTVVLCSAKTGQGITNLLEHVQLLAEMEELKANPLRPAVATVIEGHLDSSLGPVASIIINAGTLQIGDIIVCGVTSGRVKSMEDSHGTRIGIIGPSGAVRIAGLSAVPETGDILQVVPDEGEAKKVLQHIQEVRDSERKRGLKDLITRLTEGKMHILKIVLKADSLGEIEAIQNALANTKRSTLGVIPKVVHNAVGNVSESDVMMAAASDGIVLGFNVTLSTHVEAIARKYGVEVRLYDVIYKLLEDIEGLLLGLVEPEEEESVMGHLTIRGLFFRKKSDQVVGGMVTDGVLKRVPFRLMREGKDVGSGRITSLKHIDKDVKEAKEGKEYGLRIDCSFDLQEGDVLEAFTKEFKKKS